MMNRLNNDDELARQVRHYVALLRCPKTFMAAVEDACQTGVTYKQAFEQVEQELEEKTGMRHYPAGGYDAFRVTKSDLQRRNKK